MNQKGFFVVSLLLYLLIFTLIIFGAYNIWNLRNRLTSIETNIQQAKPVESSSLPSATGGSISGDWNTVQFSSFNLTLKYPPGWNVQDKNNTISQFAPPSKVNPGVVYNLIKVSAHTGVLVRGYYDIDLFSKLYNLNADEVFIPPILNEDDTEYKKITSGSIASGQKYVLLSLSTKKDKGLLTSYILKDNSLIILTLTNNDNFGLEVFEEILKTASFD